MKSLHTRVGKGCVITGKGAGARFEPSIALVDSRVSRLQTGTAWDSKRIRFYFLSPIIRIVRPRLACSSTQQIIRSTWGSASLNP